MGKQVVIQEGDTAKKFGGTIALLTNLTGGGTCQWIPEDSRKLTTKSISKNGTYRADSETDSDNNSYYGFSQVTVHVPKSSSSSGSTYEGDEIIGTSDPDDGGDGNEYAVGSAVSPSTGETELTETVLPSRIDITTNPTKSTYSNGEAIDVNGMVVKAYKKDGSLWTEGGYEGGVIPLNEITISPDKADVEELEPTKASSDLDLGSVTSPFPFHTGGGYAKYKNKRDEEDITTYIFDASGAATTLCIKKFPGSSDIGHQLIMASSAPFQYTQEVVTSQSSSTTTVTVDGETKGYKFTHNDKTVIYHSVTNSYMYGNPYCYEVSPDFNNGEVFVGSASSDKMAWTMVYGDITGGGQKITVTWNRPVDSKALTDTFTITATSSS